MFLQVCYVKEIVFCNYKNTNRTNNFLHSFHAAVYLAQTCLCLFDECQIGSSYDVVSGNSALSSNRDHMNELCFMYGELMIIL